jgi:threonine/homoserine/homoserine lactone efflux protein
MLSAIAAGVILGLSAGLAPGPLLALVVTQTLKHSVREGMKVASAPLITDAPIIVLSVLLLSKLNESNYVLGSISFIGGLYVLYLSYENIRTKNLILETGKDQPQSLKKGALVNALNPHPYLFWMTVGAPMIFKTYNESSFSPAVFVLSFYVMLVGSKLALALIVGKSRTFLTSRGYIWVLRILGGMLALFACFLIKDAFVFLGIGAR